jgi:signal transduction histidine kinase
VIFRPRVAQPYWRSPFLPQFLSNEMGRGVRVSRVEKDYDAKPRLVYDPTHPDAIQSGPRKGYVEFPKIRKVPYAVTLAPYGHFWFELQAPAQPLHADGSPDLFAQLLDKLVANAVDFGRPGTPIRIALAQAGHAAQLTVTNSGPPIPDAVRGRLFESMISARGERAGSEPHLGLGLYIARLIAEFHGGNIAAANLPDGRGVSVRLTLPFSAGNIAA